MAPTALHLDFFFRCLSRPLGLSASHFIYPPPHPFAACVTCDVAVKQGTKQAFTKKGEQPSLPTCFAGGAAAGAGFWGVWYPLETLKTRMQVSFVVQGARQSEVGEEEGCFFRGISRLPVCRLCRLSSMLCF